MQKALTPWGARQWADSLSEAAAISTDIPAIDIKASEVEARLDEAGVGVDLTSKEPAGKDPDQGIDDASNIGQKTRKAAAKSHRRGKSASQPRSAEGTSQVRPPGQAE